MTSTNPLAHQEAAVKSLYQDDKVAESYIKDRFSVAWSRLLHRAQTRALNRLISDRKLETALELAPGPARIAPDLHGLKTGLMVEASEQMIDVARRRLVAKGLDKVWQIQHGNAFDLSPVARTFDFAFTFRFIRHFEIGDRQRLYREIAARLNPAGILVFDVVNRPVRERLDAREKPAEGALPVYDVTYTADEFRREMASNGFEVLALHEVVRHIGVQSWLSYTVGPRSPWLAWTAVRLLEKLPTPNPLEWVAVCRKAD